VSGISTGALIAPFAFLGPEYDGVLRTNYTTIREWDVIRSRGILAVLALVPTWLRAETLGCLIQPYQLYFTVYFTTAVPLVSPWRAGTLTGK
jgi:hypothetical protein